MMKRLFIYVIDALWLFVMFKFFYVLWIILP